MKVNLLNLVLDTLFSGVVVVLKIDGSLVSVLLSRTHSSKSSLVPQKA